MNGGGFASPIVKMLGVATDRAGCACVGPTMNVPDAGGVFVVGDTATLVQNGRPLPGVAQVALQQGRYVGQLIARELSGRKPPRPFRYFDEGNMAVIGKSFAIMESSRLRLAGFTAWFVWAFVDADIALGLVLEGARAIHDDGFFGIGAKTYYLASAACMPRRTMSGRPLSQRLTAP